jgi:hypothetical protein
VACLLLVACATELCAQKAPYDVFPPAEAPYYRVRYEVSDKPAELIYGVNYALWIPPGVKRSSLDKIGLLPAQAP